MFQVECMVSPLPAPIHRVLQWPALLLGGVLDLCQMQSRASPVCTWTVGAVSSRWVSPRLTASSVCAGAKLRGRGRRWDARGSGDCDCDSRKCLTLEDNAAAGPLGPGQRFITVSRLYSKGFKFGQGCVQMFNIQDGPCSAQSLRWTAGMWGMFPRTSLELCTSVSCV